MLLNKIFRDVNRVWAPQLTVFILGDLNAALNLLITSELTAILVNAGAKIKVLDPNLGRRGQRDVVGRVTKSLLHTSPRGCKHEVHGERE